MSRNLDPARAGILAELSDRDLEAVTAGKADTAEGRRDLDAGGPFASMAAFAQLRSDWWNQFGLAGRRRPV